MDPSQRRPHLAIRIVKRLAVCTPIAFAIAYPAISLVTAEQLTRPTNHPLTLDPRAVSLDATPWSTRTSDGVTLRGWYYPTEKRRHLVVLVHGLWSAWPEMAALGRDLHAHDYDVLLFDLRGHGQSDPSRVFMGAASAGTCARCCRGRIATGSRTIASAGSAIRWEVRPC